MKAHILPIFDCATYYIFLSVELLSSPPSTLCDPFPPYNLKIRPTIELPIKTDVSWPGHRFSLNSISLSSPTYRVGKASQSPSRTASLSVAGGANSLGQNNQRGHGGQQETVVNYQCHDEHLETVLGEDDIVVGVDTESAADEDEISVVFANRDDDDDSDTGRSQCTAAR